jgi:hypothetical protein
MTTRVVIQQAIAGNADERYSLADFSFRPGEVVDLDDTLAASWIEGGIAVSQEDFAASIPVTPGNTPPPEPIAPTPPAGFVGDPSETAAVQWPVGIADTDIAFVTTPATVVIDSVFLIDAEYMTVVDLSSPDNPGVTRGTYGSTAAEHAAGAPIYIWAPQTASDSAPASKPAPASKSTSHTVAKKK